MANQRQNEKVTDSAPGEVTGERDGEGTGKNRSSSVGTEIRQTLRGELTDVIRDAAIEVLTPVARKATTSAAKFAVTRGPELLKDVVGPRLQGAGGAMALVKGMASKAGGALPGLGGGSGDDDGDGGGSTVSGTGRGRRLPVQEHIDVAVPIEIAYDQWTQFEEFPTFMRGVERVEQRDDKTLVWTEKLWGVRRSWVSEITDQRPMERIAWRSTSGPQQAGVVTFHKLSDRLTRVQVNLDHQPSGLFERTASGMRYTRRALESDLRRFQALVEMSEEATGGWRGRIDEGEVVEDSGEQGRDDREELDDQEDSDRARGEDDAEYEDQEFDEEEEPEEEEKPKRAAPPRRRRSTAKYDEDGEPDKDVQRSRPRRRATASRR
jgi:uncharacterized membrane protein